MHNLFELSHVWKRLGLGEESTPHADLFWLRSSIPHPTQPSDKIQYLNEPPKCYFDTEAVFVEWALSRRPFTEVEFRAFVNESPGSGEARHCTFDCTIMEHADDIEFGVHDLEDIVAHHMVCFGAIIEGLRPTFHKYGPRIGTNEQSISLSDFKKEIFEDQVMRRDVFGRLINLFVASAQVKQNREFVHPLLRLRLCLEESANALLAKLKDLTYNLVIQRPEVQQCQRQGQRKVQQLFDALIAAPESLIPTDTWRSYSEDDSNERKVCDYIAGMTDTQVERMCRCLFFSH